MKLTGKPLFSLHSESTVASWIVRWSSLGEYILIVSEKYKNNSDYSVPHSFSPQIRFECLQSVIAAGKARSLLLKFLKSSEGDEHTHDSVVKTPTKACRMDWGTHRLCLGRWGGGGGGGKESHTSRFSWAGHWNRCQCYCFTCDFKITLIFIIVSS